MWRNIASNALTFLVVVVFLFGGMLIWAQQEYEAAGPLGEPICLEVPRGTNMTRVSDNLAEQGAVSSGMLFRLGADYADKTQELKAGSYLVPEGASMREIVDIVTRGGASTCGTEVVYRIGVTAPRWKCANWIRPRAASWRSRNSTLPPKRRRKPTRTCAPGPTPATA